jgi:hypothetical protein
MSSRSGPLGRAWRANLFSPVTSTVEPEFTKPVALASFNAVRQGYAPVASFGRTLSQALFTSSGVSGWADSYCSSRA